jgi:hypothetical protein
LLLKKFERQLSANILLWVVEVLYDAALFLDEAGSLSSSSRYKESCENKPIFDNWQDESNCRFERFEQMN